MSEISILYVEDEETDVMLLQHVFTRVGITNLLKTVKDGKEAKDYLAGNPPYNDRQVYPIPGLLLLDLNLPVLVGPRSAGMAPGAVPPAVAAGGDLHLLPPPR